MPVGSLPRDPQAHPRATAISAERQVSRVEELNCAINLPSDLLAIGSETGDAVVPDRGREQSGEGECDSG